MISIERQQILLSLIVMRIASQGLHGQCAHPYPKLIPNVLYLEASFVSVLNDESNSISKLYFGIVNASCQKMLERAGVFHGS